MSVHLGSVKLDIIESTICERTAIDRSLAPYASSLDLIGMRVIDLAQQFHFEDKPISEMAQKTARIFFEAQLELEMKSAFCPRSTLNEASCEKVLASLKNARASLRSIIEIPEIKCSSACDGISKLYFLVETRVKKFPYEHVVKPLPFEDLNYDLITEKSLSRLILHLQHYNHEASNILNVKLPLIDSFLLNPVLYDAEPLAPKLEMFEEVFRGFLWSLKIEQKKLSSSCATASSRDLPKILTTCRFLHLFYYKVLSVAACIERLRQKELAPIGLKDRMSLHPELFPVFSFYVEMIEKCHRYIFQSLSKIKDNPRYPAHAEALDKAFIDASIKFACPTMHHDENMMGYLSETIHNLSLLPLSQIELYFEGYFLNKEMEALTEDSLCDPLAVAFFKIYEQCQSSLDSDLEAAKLKKDLQAILPYLRVYSCLQETLLPIAHGAVIDALYPKPCLDNGVIVRLLKQASDKFLNLEIEETKSKSPIACMERFLTDPILKLAFEHVNAS